MKLFFEASVNSSLSEIKSRFNEELFLKLKPPFLVLELERFDGCEVGNEVHLRMGLPGMLQKWISTITDAKSTSEEWLFVDEGSSLPYPFKSWRHEHRVKKITDTQSVITDSIEYDCGNNFVNSLLWAPLWLSFSIRPSVYRKVFGEI